MRCPYLYAIAFVVALDVASALSLVDECEGDNASIPLVRPLSEGNRVKWWLGISHSDSNRGTTPSNVLANILPVAWLHVPKSGSSLFNAIIHIPGACPSVPEDFEATIHGLHNPLPILGFQDMFGALPHSCPGAFNPNWNGGHRGIANDVEFDTQFKGHSLIMLRQPEQRIISAWRDTQHSWPYPQKPFARNISEFAEGIQGCATKMLTRGGSSHFMDTRSFHITYGPHWGGPCGDPMKPSAGEVTLAKARLRDFVFLGITDQWQMSMCLFHAIMGTHCHSADFADSQTKDEMDHPDYNAEAQLGDFHDPYDGELFEYAVALFAQKLAEYGLSPNTCKPCFDEAGVMFTNS